MGSCYSYQTSPKAGAHLSNHKMILYDQSGVVILRVPFSYRSSTPFPPGCALYDENDKIIQDCRIFRDFTTGRRVVYNDISYPCHLSCHGEMLRINDFG